MHVDNSIILASAGAGKTTRIVHESYNFENKRVLITTFTEENTNSIKEKFFELYGYIPKHISIMPWYTFLLQDLVRPFQNCIYQKRISKLYLSQGKSTMYEKKGTKKYYLLNQDTIYADKLVEFFLLCNKKTDGAVIERLEKLYDKIYIDEVQDLAGYDLDLVEMIMDTKISVTLVGDLRQATFSTNMSSRFKKFKGPNTMKLYELWQSEGICKINYMNHSYRCVQEICDFSDALFQEGLFDRTHSKNEIDDNHKGIFYLFKEDLETYIELYNPQILRPSKRQSLGLLNEMNIGQSKGLTFDRVLIVPTGPIVKYLKTEINQFKPKSLSSLYVGVTRAKYSVVFLVPDNFKTINRNVRYYKEVGNEKSK